MHIMKSKTKWSSTQHATLVRRHTASCTKLSIEIINRFIISLYLTWMLCERKCACRSYGSSLVERWRKWFRFHPLDSGKTGTKQMRDLLTHTRTHTHRNAHSECAQHIIQNHHFLELHWLRVAIYAAYTFLTSCRKSFGGWLHFWSKCPLFLAAQARGKGPNECGENSCTVRK